MEQPISPLPYAYRRLDTESSIRVLDLLPAEDFSSPLHANLRQLDRNNFRLGDAPDSYEAVSYSWGEPNFSHILLLDSGTSILRITANVDSMLRYFRGRQRIRTLWIDAISLNQADMGEKAVQVARMGEIYRDTDKVRVWLGDASSEDHIPAVFAFLKTLAGIREFERSRDAGITGVEEKDARKLTHLTNSQMLKCLGALFSRPWFTRRWVLQEVAFAQDITIQCGSAKMAWKWFDRGVNALNSSEASKHFIPGYQLQLNVKNVVIINGGAGIHSLQNLLWIMHTMACSNLADRLFSLYGILSRRDEAKSRQKLQTLEAPSLPAIDYSQPWYEIYVQFAKYLAIREERTYWQHLFAFKPISQRFSACPSWVPDWTSERSSHYPRIGERSGDFDRATRIVEIDGKMKLELKCSIGGPILEVINAQPVTEDSLHEVLDAICRKCKTDVDPGDSNFISVEDDLSELFYHAAITELNVPEDDSIRSLRLRNRDMDKNIVLDLMQPTETLPEDQIAIRKAICKILRHNYIFRIAGARNSNCSMVAENAMTGEPPHGPKDSTLIGIGGNPLVGDYVLRLVEQKRSHTSVFTVREDISTSTDGSPVYRLIDHCIISRPRVEWRETTVILV